MLTKNNIMDLRRSSRNKQQVDRLNPNTPVSGSTSNRKRKTTLVNPIPVPTQTPKPTSKPEPKRAKKDEIQIKSLKEALELKKSKSPFLSDDDRITNRKLFMFFKSYFENLNNTIHNRFMSNYKTICSVFSTLKNDSTGIENLGCTLSKITDPQTKFSKFIDEFNSLKLENPNNDLIDYFDLEICDQISKGLIKISGLACKHADTLSVDTATSKVKNAVDELLSFQNNELTNTLALEKTNNFLYELNNINRIDDPITIYNELSKIIKKYLEDLNKIVADLETVKAYDHVNPNMPERDISHVMNSFKCYLSRLKYNISPCQKFRMYVKYFSDLQSQDKLKDSLKVLSENNNDITVLIKQLFDAKIDELKNLEQQYELTEKEKKNVLPAGYEDFENMVVPLVVEDIDNFSKFYDENRCEIVGGGRKKKAKRTTSLLNKISKYMKKLAKKK